jgi:predicted flap endonuclease-1-like 5' DNA nuclease
MAISIGKLKGMNADLEAKLKAEGLGDSDKLLAATKAPADRKALAKKIGAGEREILELANRADLSRIKGVAGVFSDLLEQAGVDTVKELAKRRADNLHAKIKEVNDASQLAKRIPTAADVESWVTQAKELPKLLSY